MNKTGILWLKVIVIGLERQRMASALQGLSFICWEYPSVGGQRARKVSLSLAVEPNMWLCLRQ